MSTLTLIEFSPDKKQSCLAICPDKEHHHIATPPIMELSPFHGQTIPVNIIDDLSIVWSQSPKVVDSGEDPSLRPINTTTALQPVLWPDDLHLLEGLCISCKDTPSLKFSPKNMESDQMSQKTVKTAVKTLKT